MGTSFSLSVAAVDILSQMLGTNARLFPLEIPSVGQMQADRLRIARAVFTDLARRGLVQQGDLVEDLTLALRTLSDYQVAVAVMGCAGRVKGAKGTEIFARASTSGDAGVLAVQEGQLVRLELIRPTALAAAAVALLPPAPAGPGQSVTLTKPATRRHDGEDREGYFPAVRGSGRVSDHAWRVAQSYLTRPRTGAGFFAVSGRGRHGRDIRAGEVGWLDTDAGRYLTLPRPPGDNNEIHCTFSPADRPRLVQQIAHLAESVRS